MAQGKKTAIPIKKIVAALVKFDGHQSNAAKFLKISRITLWTLQKQNPEIAEAYNEIVQSQIDDIESSLVTMARGIPKMENVTLPDGSKQWLQTGWACEPDPRAAKMLLDAKAKDRGYGKQELTLNTTEPMQVMVVNRIMTREEVKGEGSAMVVD